MGMSRADYLSQLQALLPQGPAWPRETDALLTRLLDAFAAEYARADSRTADLIEEADPRTTAELLADWERVAGLPGKCALLAGLDLTVEQRRAALVAKIVARGGQSRAFFIALAASLGYTVTITEFSEWSFDSDVDAPLFGSNWLFAFQVNAQLNTVGDWTFDSDVDTPFAWWGNAQLECAIGGDKPAHTVTLFSYT